MKPNKLLVASSQDANDYSTTERILRPPPFKALTHTLRNIFLAVAGLCLTVAGPTIAMAQCILFPLNQGPEEVCASGVFPDDLITISPGGSVTVPLIEFLNNTDREMTFTVDTTGVNISSGIVRSAILAPGDTTTFTDVVLFVVNDSTPFRTSEEIIVGWSAFGSLEGADYYFTTVENSIELRVDGLDSDGDGLLDSWETDGYDADGDGIVDVDLPAMGADPLHKDIFVELDWEIGAALFRESIQMVKEAFAMAPIDAGGTPNPDGLPGINLWVDTGGLLDATGDLVGDNFGGGNELELGPWTFASDFYGAKESAFNPNRAAFFHYGIVSSQIGGGQGEVGGNDFWLGATASWGQLAYVLMHELGHNLNLSHGGDPDENGIRNCEPNYISTMNYRYSFIGLAEGGVMLDFAPARFSTGGRAGLPRDLEEANLDETEAFDLTDAEHRISYVGPPEICYAICDGGDRNGESCIDDDECRDESNPSADGTCEGFARICEGGLRVGERCEDNFSCVDYGACEGGPSVGLQCLNHSECPESFCSGPQYSTCSTIGPETCSDDSACGGGRCGGLLRTALPNQAVDFNEKLGLEASVRQNIDYKIADLNGICASGGFSAEITMLPDTSLTPHDDWSNISLPFWFFGESANAAMNPVIETITEEQIVKHLEEINTTNLVIVKTGPAGPVEAATDIELKYELSVSNLGPHLGGSVVVQDLLPSGFHIAGPTELCTEQSSGVVFCTIEALQVDTSTSVEINVEGKSLCNDAGFPEAIVNYANVENRSEFPGADVDPSDNRTMFTTLAVDTTPPEVTCNAPDKIAPLEATISFTTAATDSCDSGLSDPMITGYECFSFTRKGLRVDRSVADKKGSCMISLAGSTINILDAGGVGNTIEWTAETTDATGNVTEKTCSVQIVRKKDL